MSIAEIAQSNFTFEGRTEEVMHAQLAAALAAALAAEKDALIRAEVTKRLGHSSWQVLDIAYRMRREIQKDLPQEKWSLDGEPLIEIWPPEIRFIQEGGVNRLKARIQYRVPHP